MKFLCDQCKAKYQIADEKVAGRTVRMKCRKCGHLIEVRAAVTETSVATNETADPATVSSQPPAPASDAPPKAAVPPPPRPPPRAVPPPRPGSLSTSLTSAKPPVPKGPKADRPGALAGAFKTTVQREEEISAPFDMSELSPGDGWYVAINGVPVGPIRMSEVRRKAALGAVTEDSLVWQDGFDEWRPARSLPELAAIVREAATSGRASVTPPPPGARSSVPPPPRVGPSISRPSIPAGIPPRSPRPSTASIPTGRSNVVPIMSRLATAERIDQAEARAPSPSAPPEGAPSQPAIVADPFAPAAPAASAAPLAAAPAPARIESPASTGVATVATSVAPGPVKARKPVPWVAVAMVAGAVAFGISAGLFTRSSTPAAAVQSPIVASAPVVQPTVTAAAPAPSAASVDPVPTVGQPVKAALAAKPTGASASAAATGAGRSLDLHSLTQNSSVSPMAEEPGEGPKAPGQCFSQGQVQSVIGLHQLAIRRSCWERDPTTKPTVNVSVAMTIAPDGAAQGVSATGDEGSVAKCIENDVRGWHFPAMGCSQKTNFSFKFVRQ